jgi:subtilisin family serine protease
LLEQIRSEDKIDWGLKMFGITDAQLESGGEGVHVGVCDTGWPAGGHEDLPEPVNLRNFTNERDGYDRRQGHGAHVAGIIGGLKNSKGMLGVAPRCKLSSYRCLGSSGSGNSQWIANSIKAAVDDGCDIINLSLGGPYYRGTEEACEYAAKNDIFVLVAAGNAGMRGMDYPALLPSTLAIASMRSDGDISNFSSRGDEVDIAAPGERIFSTWLNNRYNVLSGTSMACPFACGVLALMLASRTDYSITVRNSRELRGQMSPFTQDKGRPGDDREFGDGIWRVGDMIDAFRGNIPENFHL